MKKPASRSTRRQGEVIGRERFAWISAVEGIRLSGAAKRRAAEAERQGLSPEERRRAIVRAHRGG